MAITLISEPKYNFNPVYNPIVYVVSSDNINAVGFNYIFEVYEVITDGSGTTDKLITSLKVKPGADGYGRLSLNRILQDYVTYDFNPTSDDYFSSTPALKSQLDYKVVFKEEYHLDWEFENLGIINSGGVDYNYVYNKDPLAIPRFEVYALQTGNPVPEITLDFNSPVYGWDDLDPEDKELYDGEVDSSNGLPVEVNNVRILKNNYYLTVEDDGEYGILLVNNTETPGVAFALDPYWKVTGTIKLRNREKFVSSIEIVKGGKVFNGVFEPLKFNKLDMEDYNFFPVFNNTQLQRKKMLTTLPFDYTLREDNTLLVNVYDTSSEYSYKDNTVTVEIIGSDTYSYIVDIEPTDNKNIQQYNVGTSNPSIKTRLDLVNAKEYYFYVNVQGVAPSKKYHIKVDRGCPHSENIEICFLDSLGSFVPFNFPLRNEQSIKVNTTEMIDGLGDLEEPEFGKANFKYDLTGGGKKIIYSNYERVFRLRTGFLSVDMSKYFEELVKSPVTFIKLEDTYVKCLLNTKSIDIKGEKWFELKRYEIEVELSIENKTNI